jgi:hypothetical protein
VIESLKSGMKRTLLAVGVAVLVSMMLAPHGDKYGVKGFGPFFSNGAFIKTSSGDWYRGWWDTGIFYGVAGRVMIDMLALEMVFLGVLAALVINLPTVARKWLVSLMVVTIITALIWNVSPDLGILIVLFLLGLFLGCLAWYASQGIKHRKG